MTFGFQVVTETVESESALPIAVEASDSAALALLNDDELGEISGGAHNAGSSTSGFSRNRMAMTKGTFAGPEGAGSFSSVMTEEVSSFGQETWDICQ